MQKINLADKFNLISEYWSQKIVGELNDSHIKLAKLKGEFVWHKHEYEDELLCIIKGKLLIKFREEDVSLEAGECLIIPKGVEHLPIAEEEVYVMFVEPKTTINTGGLANDSTKEHQSYI
jgi:mannose-6-phosphate isomerase-like protein (cupin superfamily)